MAEGSGPQLVRAAGAVLWRASDAAEPNGTVDGLEIALVHRPKYDDWSLPKGKLLTAEHPLVGAAREVAEETGYSAVAGRPLGELQYPVRVADAVAEKVVRYWAMHAVEGGFTPNDEVDELRWLAPPDAKACLSYAHDRGPLRRLLRRPYRTTTILLVRHGRAGQRSAWLGPDRLRPLDATGRAQADAVRAVAPCFRPGRVISADLTRCIDTVAPLASSIGVSVEVDPTLEESAHAQRPDRTIGRIRELAENGRPLALCSQGGVIPDLVNELASADGVNVGGKVAARKGSMWALSFAGTILVDAEYFPSLQVGGS
jgi:8-oxo-dGTP pyrophosphatase MutT (NUDIX family)/phosphohistidine phosphatase SixA